MDIIETHAHLDFEQFDVDRDAVLNRAREAGVSAFINISLHPGEADKTFELMRQYDDVYAAVGIHPHASAQYGNRIEAAVEALKQLAGRERVVALGEMGLDYYRDYSPRDVQHRVFAAQLELAAELGLPVVIHNRQADKDVLEHLAAREPAQVIIHCFSGDTEMARQCARRGYYIGIGGVLTYPRASELRQIVAGYPRDLVVLETDCPFLAPQPRRGRRNEPAYLAWVVETLAQVWEVSPEEAAAITSKNARRVFGLPDHGGR